MTAKSVARIYRPTVRNFAFLASRLRAGELVAVPSETVYGLAANALDAVACAAIFKAKGRPSTDPLIVHINAISQLGRLCEAGSDATRLARRFWPGPLTIVLPKKTAVPDIVTAGKQSVAVRMPRHPDFLRLIEQAGVPLAAPSANPFGYISPTTAEHVRANLGRRIRYILDGGPAQIGVESTILDLRDNRRPQILRPGAISARQLSGVLGREVGLATPARTRLKAAQIAPGMLKRHYSPRTPVVLHTRIQDFSPDSDAFVLMRKPSGSIRANVRWLAKEGNLQGAAKQLFATLRELDQGRYRHIHAELARPGDGDLAAAINDRLRRAAAR
jgi:L-threonylcarbamoyladenylate synthase